MKVLHQHGDLILHEANAIPQGAKKITIKGNFILEKGEGVNLHELVVDDGALEIYEANGTIYLKTHKPVQLTHKEHGTQTLEPNKIYKKVIEREFDYESNEARQTRD
jgi:hypothetical protein